MLVLVEGRACDDSQGKSFLISDHCIQVFQRVDYQLKNRKPGFGPGSQGWRETFSPTVTVLTPATNAFD
jgi:hypothetical protein